MPCEIEKQAKGKSCDTFLVNTAHFGRWLRTIVKGSLGMCINPPKG